MDELELIRRILAGDEEAKSLFYRNHQKRLYPIAVHFLGYQDPDAEDVVQETFLIALQKLKDFEPRSTLYTWMAHITINLCYERLRKRKRQLASMEEDLEKFTAGISADNHAQLGPESERQALILKVRESVSQLGPNCRAIVEYRDLQGMSYADIGKKMKLPIGTVMSRLARCRETLKQMFLKEPKGPTT